MTDDELKAACRSMNSEQRRAVDVIVSRVAGGITKFIMEYLEDLHRELSSQMNEMWNEQE